MSERHTDSPPLSSESSSDGDELPQLSRLTPTFEGSFSNVQVPRASTSSVQNTAEKTSLTQGHRLQTSATGFSLSSECMGDDTPPRQIAAEDLSTLQNYGADIPQMVRHGDCYSFDLRLETFGLWPVALRTRPVDLAEAGFFYTGEGDRTICFHCGGTLSRWKDNDDPWEQHAVWFPGCQFLTMVKGRAFVDEIKTRYGLHSSIGDDRNEIAEGSLVTPMLNPSGILSDTGSASAQTLPASGETASPNGTATTSAETATASTQAASSSEEVGSTFSETASTSKGAACSSYAMSSKTHAGESFNRSEELSRDIRCKICFVKEIQIVFLPCGHIVACAECAITLRVCAICMTKIGATLRAFLS